jgi:23S rRNA (guanosine2251-2'-O)-methyltransferase
VIYGLNPVREALRSRRQPLSRILLIESGRQGRFGELIELARVHGVRVERSDRRQLDLLSGQANHQGIVAVLGEADRAAYLSPEEILDHLSSSPLLVLLDGVEDPHNLGAILRSCDGAGVDGVFIPEHRAVGLSETVAKTSAGASAHVRIGRVTNLVPLIADLKDRGIWVVGVEGDGERCYTEFDFAIPLALVFGSEGKGIRRLVRERCDAIVSIPMRGRVNSLNVSVAAGVVLFEVLRQRRKS